MLNVRACTDGELGSNPEDLGYVEISLWMRAGKKEVYSHRKYHP